MTCGVWSYTSLRQGGGIDEECTQSDGMDGIFFIQILLQYKKGRKTEYLITEMGVHM
jgi:hypothetical protein